MKYFNNDIIKNYEKIKLAFDDNTKYFPAKINYIIQKNLRTLEDIAREIENTKNQIVIHYGVQDPNDPETYNFEGENARIAQKELNDLLEVKQEVQLLKLTLKDIESLEFTSNQMGALLFMIDEESQADE